MATSVEVAISFRLELLASKTNTHCAELQELDHPGLDIP
jgi:hypothetical protein